MALALILVVAYPMVVALSRAVFRSIYMEVLAVSIHANLPLLTLGTLGYQLIGTIVAVCVESSADSAAGGESAGGTFKGLLASLTVQHPTLVHTARIYIAIAAPRNFIGKARV